MDSIKDELKLEKQENAVILQESTALNLLSQYTDSEGEDNENETTEAVNAENYRQTKDSSDSSSSSSDSEIDVKEIRKKLEASVSDDDSESEEPTKERKKRPALKVKGELLLEDLPPIQDLEIEVDAKECLEIGTITSIIDQLVLVEGYPHSAPLDIDSILFLDLGKRPLGKVFDVIGQVSAPIYCVRFNTNEDIVSKNITLGDKVFCAPRTEYASFVILTKIMGRGSDASWKNDVEIPDNMIEYSDDEEEKKSRRPKAAAKRKFPPQQHSWHNQLNYQQQPNWNNQQQHPQQSNWANQQQQQQNWTNQHQQQNYLQNYGYYPQNPYSQ